MYVVYRLLFDENWNVIKRLVYAPNTGEDGYFINSGKLKTGLNIAGELSIVVPVENPSWTWYFKDGTLVKPDFLSLSQGTILAVELVEEGISKEIWRGRVISQSWDIYQNMILNCEGILAFLNDVLVPQYNFSWTGIISQAYDPNEGLKFINLDLLKDLMPGLTKEGIGDTIKNVVDNVISNDSFSPDIEGIYDTLTKGLPISTTNEDGSEDNVDRRVTVYDYLIFMLTIYNAELTQKPSDIIKQIKIGYIDPLFKTDQYLINHKTDRYAKIWDEISSNILDLYGGVMFLSNWYKDSDGNDRYDPKTSYLYYYKTFSGESSQVIQYGENLVDFEIEQDNTDVVTRWYVFGSAKDANGKEIEIDMSSANDFNPGMKYVGEPFGIGTISKVEYTDLTTPQDCFNRGIALLNKSLYGTRTLTVNAVDMNIVDHSIKAFEPGQKVRMIMDNKSYEYNTYLRVESINIDLLSPENSEYVFKQVGEG